MSWDLKFPEPIAVPKGKPLVTLRNAGAYITALPDKTYAETAWQTAMGCLLFAADQDGPIEFARLAMMQALQPKPEPVYHSASKDPKWRNRYKLARNR